MIYFLISVLAVVLTAMVFYQAGYKNGVKNLSNIIVSTLNLIKNMSDDNTKEELE